MKTVNDELICAMKSWDTEAAIKLLENDNIKINQAQKDGTTPLHIATQYKYLEIVSKLLKHKEIDINQSDINGVTPLHIATQHGYEEIVSELLKHDEINTNKEV